MKTSHAVAVTAIAATTAVGFATLLDVGSGIDLESFSVTSTVDTTTVDDSATCTMEITDADGVDNAVCAIQSPSGTYKTSCIGLVPIIGTVTDGTWTCQAPFSALSEAGDWDVLYVHVNDAVGNSAKFTNADMIADIPNVIPDAAALIVTVTSPNADTAPPVIDTFGVVPATVDPGSAVTCAFSIPDENLRDVGCTFAPEDGSSERSCISSEGMSCDLVIPADADAGVVWNEVNHFARDTLGNINIVAGDAFVTTSGSPPGSCDSYVYDYRAVGPVAWAPTQGPETAAWDTLVADFYARVLVADEDAGIGFQSDTPVNWWLDLAMAVRFSGTNNWIDVNDGPGNDYSCDSTCPTYTPGTWYHFVVTANLIDTPTATYNVDYAVCNDSLTRLKTGAVLRAGTTHRPISYHGGWTTTGNLEVDQMSWTPTGSSPSGTVSVNVTSPAPTAGCDLIEWTITPGGFTGSTDFGPQSVANGDYTITWSDLDVDCTVPTPVLKTVADDAQTFDLSTNFTLRTARAGTVDVGLDDGGSPPLSGAPPGGGAWTADASGVFSGQYSDSGTGDGSLGATLRDGRTYVVSFTPEDGYFTPPPDTIVAQATSQIAQGDYTTQGAGGTGGTGGSGGIDTDTLLADITGIRDNPQFSYLFQFTGSYAGVCQNVSREMTYLVQALVTSERAGLARKEESGDVMLETLIPWMEAHFWQWKQNGYDVYAAQCAGAAGPYRFAPFMAGLSMHGLIEFYEWEVDNARDPNAYWAAAHWADMETMLQDFLAWMYNDSGMWVDQTPELGSFIYETPGGSSPAWDLNNLIAPAYGWIGHRYAVADDETNALWYFDIGDRLFAGSAANAYIAGGGKQFNQAYRWSFKYVEWRAAAKVLIPSISALPRLAQWESEMETYGRQWGIYQNPSGGHNLDQRLVAQYYDGQWVHQQIGDYRGETEPWATYADYNETVYRDQYLRPNDYGAQGYRRFPHGIYNDYIGWPWQ